jgi:hypothetical protein
MKSNLRNAVAPLLLFAAAGVIGVLTTNVSAAGPIAPTSSVFVAQTKAAESTKTAEAPARTPEEKKRVKSAVILLSVLSGIALSGLLMIIAAIAIRGLQRKLAGPTRLDRDPRDLFPVVPPRPHAEAPPVVPPAEVDQSSEETRLT